MSEARPTATGAYAEAARAADTSTLTSLPLRVRNVIVSPSIAVTTPNNSCGAPANGSIGGRGGARKATLRAPPALQPKIERLA
jgi:hypothetical protein